MARIPTDKEVKKLKTQTQAEIDKKTIRQNKQGKNFVPTGAGVIPEPTWRNLEGKK